MSGARSKEPGARSQEPGFRIQVLGAFKKLEKEQGACQEAIQELEKEQGARKEWVAVNERLEAVYDELRGEMDVAEDDRTVHKDSLKEVEEERTKMTLGEVS